MGHLPGKTLSVKFQGWGKHQPWVLHLLNVGGETLTRLEGTIKDSWQLPQMGVIKKETQEAVGNVRGRFCSLAQDDEGFACDCGRLPGQGRVSAVAPAEGAGRL